MEKKPRPPWLQGRRIEAKEKKGEGFVVFMFKENSRTSYGAFIRSFLLTNSNDQRDSLSKTFEFRDVVVGLIFMGRRVVFVMKHFSFRMLNVVCFGLCLVPRFVLIIWRWYISVMA